MDLSLKCTNTESRETGKRDGASASKGGVVLTGIIGAKILRALDRCLDTIN